MKHPWIELTGQLYQKRASVQMPRETRQKEDIYFT